MTTFNNGHFRPSAKLSFAHFGAARASRPKTTNDSIFEVREDELLPSMNGIGRNDAIHPSKTVKTQHRYFNLSDSRDIARPFQCADFYTRRSTTDSTSKFKLEKLLSPAGHCATRDSRPFL